MIPVTTGAEKLVPLVLVTVGNPGTVRPVLPRVTKLPPSPPGAASVTLLPKFAYDALLPLRPTAVTLMTPGQPAGEWSALLLSFPAETTTILPAATN